MGIKEFHKSTGHYISKVHIEKYKGQRVGCDTSAWMCRGASPYSWELWHGKAPWNDRNEDPPWVTYPMNMIRMLRDHGVEPVLVFDGCRNPAKAPTSHFRAERRKNAEHRANAALNSRDETAARKAIMQTVEVTPDMAYDLIQRLRIAKVQFIVAPYEADAQLAYLMSIPPEQGGVAAVLTEDSDLVAYGCNALLFKCDIKNEGFADEMRLDQMLSVKLQTLQEQKEKESGEGGEEKTTSNSNNEVDIIDLTNPEPINPSIATTAIATKNPPTTKKKELLSFYQWDNEMVLSCCILAGCDFLENIKGLGFKTAHGLVSQGRTLEGTFDHMRTLKRWQAVLTPEYELGAKRARESFLYALVYDVTTGSTTRLRELPETLRILSEDEIRHVGPELDEKTMHLIAHGYLNPLTMQPYTTKVPPPPPPSLNINGAANIWLTGLDSTDDTALLSNTNNIVHLRSQFVNSPAAVGGAGRGGAGAGGVRRQVNQQTTSGAGSQSRPVVGNTQRVQVQDLMQMYAHTAPSTTVAGTQTSLPQAQAQAPTETLTRIAKKALPIPVATHALQRPGSSRFAPSSSLPPATTTAAAAQSKQQQEQQPGSVVKNQNPFARAPMQPPPRSSQQPQQQQRPMATAPLQPPHHQQQHQHYHHQQQQQQQNQPLPRWFRGPQTENNTNPPNQDSVSLGSLFYHQGTATTSSLGAPTSSYPWKQQHQQQKTIENEKKGKPIAKAPLVLPPRGAPRAPESQPSVSLAALFSISNTITGNGTNGTAQNQADILARSVFFNGSDQHTSAGNGAGGGSSGNDQQEVTSPLKLPREGNTNNGREKPMAMAPLRVSQSSGYHQRQQQQQQQRQQQQQSNNVAKPTAWNVRKPTMSSFGRSTSNGNSSGGSQGAMAGKRKSGESSGGGGRKSKKVLEMNAAAANCVRISTFFAPKKS